MSTAGSPVTLDTVQAAAGQQSQQLRLGQGERQVGGGLARGVLGLDECAVGQGEPDGARTPWPASVKFQSMTSDWPAARGPSTRMARVSKSSPIVSAPAMPAPRSPIGGGLLPSRSSSAPDR